MVAEAVQALSRCGVTFDHEAHGSGGPEDPNYSGSISRINAGDYGLAVEVHFDWSRAPRGGFGHWYSDAGKRAADKILGRWSGANLPVRLSWHKQRSDLSFLKRTRPPAVLWECDRIEDYDHETTSLMGEALAAGICDALGKPYLGPGSQGPDRDKRHYNVVVMGVGDVDEILAFVLGQAHLFKTVSLPSDESPLVDIDSITTDWVLAVGAAARDARKARGLDGFDFVGSSRYETASAVMSAVRAEGVPRSRPTFG